MTSMADLVCAAGRADPGKPALRDADGGYTFGELDAVSSRFAAFLVSQGVRTGDRIAFIAPKNASLVAAILGCLKAGAIYVPIDCTAPVERIRMIVDDVVPRFVVADVALFDAIAAGVHRGCASIRLDRLGGYCRTAEPGTTLPRLTAEDVAYCLYTSGSTGRPKGVLIQHGSVDAFFRALPEAMPIHAACRCMNTSELHFDVHVMDLFFPLHRGATVHLTHPPLLADALLALIERERITHFTAVSPVMTLMTEGALFDRCDLSSLERVMTGAEVLNVATVQRWLRRVPGLSLVNGYGPTEATVICTYHLIDRVEPKRSDPYPIGRPFGESDVFLMDDGRLIDEPGVEGELLISGPQVMKGYWRDEATTCEKIVTAAGRRCYRSGDVCRRLPNGELDYVGRRDEQVKLFGYRIELGEIKRVMDAAELVCEGQTVMATHPSLGKVIAACFTSDPPDGKAEQDAIFGRLHASFKRELPYYMVPSLYCRFERFPQLPSGKTDKRAILRTVNHYIRHVDSSATRFTAPTQEAKR
jgi:amino acid adenylation domain-containing protein